MDAHAHLLSLGWAGPGHSLDSRPHKGRRGLAYDPKQAQNTGNGLIKPLLISQKRNTFGVGKKAHDPPAGTEWWLKGFETALNNIGKTASERTSGTATPDLGRNASGYTGKHAGLYGFFIKGGEMEGTIGSEFEDDHKPMKLRKKRKSDNMNEEGSSDSGSGQQRHVDETSKKKRKPKDDAADFVQVATFLERRDKDERRRVRAQKAGAVEDFEKVGDFFEARSARRRNSAEHGAAAVNDVENGEDSEQQRRRRKRERKSAKRARAVQGSSDKENVMSHKTMTSQVQEQDPESADAERLAKAVRKAERRRRKELEGRA